MTPHDTPSRVPPEIRNMSVEELGRTVMPFGKYGPKHPKGPCCFDEIPISYLRHMHEKGICYGKLRYKLEAFLTHPITVAQMTGDWGAFTPEKKETP